MSFFSNEDVLSDITTQLRGDGGLKDTSNVQTPVTHAVAEFKKDSKILKKTLKKQQQKKVGNNSGKKKSVPPKKIVQR